MKLWIVDAFTSRPFAGNPAAVCLLREARSDVWMQQVATEMNLSETAFVSRRPDGFQLRWFTPCCEVDLCGHATLASAHVLWFHANESARTTLHFFTRGGQLAANLYGDRIQLDFPTSRVTPIEVPDKLAVALGVQPEYVGRTSYDLLVTVPTENHVRSATPDFRVLANLNARGIILTGPCDGGQFDFVSRFFAPAAGIDEDPVTGSAHCALGPFWGQRLGKREMVGYQASPRGGVVHVRVEGDRTLLSGQAVTVLEGQWHAG